MSKPLRVLNIEDSIEDSLRLTTELLRGDYDLEYKRVETPEAMREALEQNKWDIVLSDYSMPNFTGLDALEIFKQSGLDLPFIIISGAIGEETAVTVLKAGAHDFIGKGNLARLLPAIERELKDAEVRREHRQAQEAIRENEEKFRTITQSSKDAIILMDNDGNISDFNQSAEYMFGYSRDEVIGKNLHQLLAPPRYHETHFKAFADFRKSGKGAVGGQTIEREGIRKDGKEFPLELSLSAFQLGGLWHAAGIIRDISARKQLEVQLRQAQKMESIGTLAAGIAHEINTPTQFVGNNNRFLQDSFKDIVDILTKCGELADEYQAGTLSPDKVAELKEAMGEADIDYLIDEIPQALQQSEGGIKSISTIVSAMRAFAHPGAVEKVSVDINDAIQNTIIVSKNEWKYVADLKTDFDTSLPQVPCHLGEFNQAILNLIVNAAQTIADTISKKEGKLDQVEDTGQVSPDEVGEHVEEKGTITIQTLKVENFVEIHVSDTGTGIPEEVRNRIFDPFFTTKDVGKGTGQGLSLVHSVVVEKHNGDVTFVTEMGRGTTFVIRLPLEVD